VFQHRTGTRQTFKPDWRYYGTAGGGAGEPVGLRETVSRAGMNLELSTLNDLGGLLEGSRHADDLNVLAMDAPAPERQSIPVNVNGSFGDS
jgi:hypothetical protein